MAYAPNRKEVPLKKFSLFRYCYRDASNYKSWGRLLLQGSAVSVDMEDLQRHFYAGEFFIAEQLNIPSLYAELWFYSGGPTIDDHVWHTFHSLRSATAQEMDAPVFDNLEKFLQREKAIQSWDETLSPHWDI